MDRDICCVDDCNNFYDHIHDGKRYCNRHYDQFLKYGYTLKRTIYDPNEIIVYDSFAELILYDKKGNENGRAKIDIEDIEKCKKYKWHKHSGGNNKEYVFTKINGKQIRMHRYILSFYDTSYDIDHINGNSFDNRYKNLAIVTRQQNLMNQRKNLSNNKSGITGVHQHSQNKNWIAQITYNDKTYHLGSFEKFEDAIEVRYQAELKYFGKYKRSNFE